MKIGHRILLTALLVMVIVGAGCQSKTSTPSDSTVANKTTEAPAGINVANQDKALVRLVNARDEKVDLYFGDMKAFAEVDGQKITPYSEVPAERRNLRVLPAGKKTATPTATNSERLSKGKHYTAVAFQNKVGSGGITLFEDNLTSPSTGKARIRVIYVATGVDEVDVYPIGQKDTLVTGVNFNSSTGYQEVDPAIKGLEIHRKGEKQVAVRVRDISLSPGKTYTFFVLNDRNTLKVIPVGDQLASYPSRLPNSYRKTD
jgi:Domain of unknown function (DUF4397)